MFAEGGNLSLEVYSVFQTLNTTRDNVVDPNNLIPGNVYVAKVINHELINGFWYDLIRFKKKTNNTIYGSLLGFDRRNRNIYKGEGDIEPVYPTDSRHNYANSISSPDMWFNIVEFYDIPDIETIIEYYKQEILRTLALKTANPDGMRGYTPDIIEENIKYYKNLQPKENTRLPIGTVASNYVNRVEKQTPECKGVRCNILGGRKSRKIKNSRKSKKSIINKKSRKERK